MNKVFLGVGHGGLDSGATSNGLKEKDINLSVALACKDELVRHGVIVGMSRTVDENDPINQEVQECNVFNPNLAVDIHTNAGGGDGFEIFYYSKGGLSKTLAQNIEEQVKTIGQNSRGVKIKVNQNGTEYYAFIRDTKAPAVIAECAFIDSLDAKIIDDVNKQKMFGNAYAKGILKTLNIPYVSSTVLSRQQFIEKIKDTSIVQSNLINVLPSLTIAQAILESNNGNSELATQANALFGIKANDWTGKKYSKLTKEVVNGQTITVNADFRAYDNWADSIADHSKLFLKERYKALINEKDYKKACYAVKEAGYATDTNYASKLIKLIEENSLYKYDEKSDIDKAFDILIEKGVIVSPDYWRGLLANVAYLGDLFIKMAYSYAK